MKKITPFTSSDDAGTVLDNGGRFYNLMTKAGDGIISGPELARAAGVYKDKQSMVLFYAMATAALDEPSKLAVRAALSDDMKQAYKEYCPQTLLPSEAETKGMVQSAAIITGIPRQIDSRVDFKGFVMIPVMTGKVMVMVMSPILDRYDVYEIWDDEDGEVFLIAHARGAEKLPARKISVGGILKEMKLEKGEEGPAKKFLESLYYSELS
ncbi:hypothetical protein [Hufsiella ginkgonis]|uniref:hypothetical protein n=1 Tax=Hufsiella ginkgonis TaxID=2695274 RepID=UPI0019289CE4|nr:hypothetical protein [Hufsiella ginkgonis]